MKLYAVLKRYQADKDYFHISEDGSEGQYFTNLMDAKKLAADTMLKDKIDSNHCVIQTIEVEDV